MKVEQLRGVVEAISTGPWRNGSVETYHIFTPNPAIDALGPERVLLRMNTHFPHVTDAAGIVALRNHAAALLDLVEACKRWQHARSYGDSDRAASDVATALEKLEAVT